MKSCAAPWAAGAASSALLLLLPILLPLPAAGAFLRSGDRGSDKLEHLLLDIDESMRKAGGDAELVFAKVLTYDQRLGASLQQEISALNSTLNKLQAMQSSYHLEIGSSQAKLAKLGHTAQILKSNASSYEAGTTKAGNKFDTVLSSVQQLVTILQKATVTADGRLSMRETDAKPLQVFSTIRRLLNANRVVQEQFPDVSATFNPVHIDGESAPEAHMTPIVLGQTVAAMKMIQAGLHQQKSKVLLQLFSRQRTLQSTAMMVDSKTAKEQGMQAENKHRAEELSYGMAFAGAVVSLDQAFDAKVASSMKTKAELVEEIRSSRQEQQKSTKDLIDLLSGKYTLGEQAGSADLAVSLLETSSEAHPSGLRAEIEKALHNHSSTHEILMSIESRLRAAVPIDANNVQSVASELGAVLREADSTDTGAEEAMEKCKSQKMHANQEEQGLKTNMALMGTVQNHTQSAIKAAKDNLEGIASKTKALETSVQDFSHVVGQGMATLEKHSTDRATIMAAVQKAGEIAGLSRSQTTAAAATALLTQMLEQLQAQEKADASYRREESSLRASFLSYARDYLQLLHERKSHYEDSLSALELYASELTSDTMEQYQSLGADAALNQEGRDLCDGVAEFFKRHKQRSQALATTLKELLPKVPSLIYGE